MSADNLQPYDAALPDPKRAPVQGFAGGIPWALHLEAYDAYCKKYGAQPALIDLGGRYCRGGFGVSELDEFVPGWRDRVGVRGYTEEQVRAILADAHAHYEAQVRQLGGLARPDTKALIAEHIDKVCMYGHGCAAEALSELRAGHESQAGHPRYDLSLLLEAVEAGARKLLGGV
jgi:hypothetical protein